MRRFACVFFAVAFSWTLVHATQTPAAACGPFQVAMYEHGALYFEGDSGQWMGIDKDVVDELARRTGCKLEQTLDSRVRIWAQLAAGTLDMTASGIPTPEREKLAHFLIYLSTRNYLLVERTLPAAARTLAGFLANPEYRVAVVKSFKHGAAYDAWLDQLREQNRVDEVGDQEAVFNLLINGRVHAMLALPTTYTPFLRQAAMAERFAVLDLAANSKPIVAGLVVSRARVPEHAVQLLEKHLLAMRRDGTLVRIYRRYLDAQVARALVRF
jgi:polar amino acid transport system substrate-binding protein